MKKKAVASLFCLAAALVSFFILPAVLGFSSPAQGSYAGSLQATLDIRLATAAAFFASTKVIAGVLTLLGSVEVELSAVFAGANINPMMVFSPLASSINKLSDLFLLAMGAIVLQKVLMVAGGWLAFKVLTPLTLILGAASLWTKEATAERLKKAVFTFAAVAVIAGLTIPLSVELGGGLEKYFLADMVAEAELNLSESTESLNNIQLELSAAEEMSFWEKAKNTLNYQKILEKAQTSLESVAESIKATAKSLINILIVISITTIILPVGTMIVLWMLLKSLFKQA